MMLSGSLSVSNANRNIDVGIHRYLVVTSVTGNGTTVTVTTTSFHFLSSGIQIQMLTWTGGTGTWNGVYVITVISPTVFTYSASGNGTATGGTTGALYATVTVRAATTGAPYPFTIIGYIQNLSYNEYIEVFLSTANSGDAVIIQDLQWLATTV